MMEMLMKVMIANCQTAKIHSHIMFLTSLSDAQNMASNEDVRRQLEQM